MSRTHEVVKHNKLCPRRPIFTRIVALIAALICILSTNVCAINNDQVTLYQQFVNQEGWTYFIDSAGNSLTSQYVLAKNIIYAPTEDIEYIPMRLTQLGTSPQLDVDKFMLPIYVDGTNTQVDLRVIIASNNANILQSYDFGTSGVKATGYYWGYMPNVGNTWITSTSIIQNYELSSRHTGYASNYDNIVFDYTQYYPSLGQATYNGQLSYITIDLSIDANNMLSYITLDSSTLATGNSQDILMVGIVNMTSLNNLRSIETSLSAIQNQLTTLNSTLSSIKTLLQTANTGSTAINNNIQQIINQSSTDIAAVEQIQQKLEQANIDINDILSQTDSYVQSNKADPEQLASQISADNALIDVQPELIGGGTTDSGIGIILNNSIVLKMLMCVLSVALIAYVLYGKRSA